MPLPSRIGPACRYILTPPDLCSQKLCVFHSMNHLLISKNLQSSTMSLLFKNHWLVEVTYLLIRFNKINFFLWNTKNSDRYVINTQKKHQHSLKERWGCKVLLIMKISGRVPPFFKTITLFCQPTLFISKIWSNPFWKKFENLNPHL